MGSPKPVRKRNLSLSMTALGALARGQGARRIDILVIRIIIGTSGLGPLSFEFAFEIGDGVWGVGQVTGGFIVVVFCWPTSPLDAVMHDALRALLVLHLLHL